jgi:hypothetical protein
VTSRRRVVLGGLMLTTPDGLFGPGFRAARGGPVLWGRRVSLTIALRV